MYSTAVVVSSMRIVLPVVFATLTVTAADVVVLPAASRATAVSVCDALLVIVVVPETVAPLAGAVMLTVGGVVSLKTVTVTAADVVVFPAASRATAVSVCDALVAVLVSHATAYGAAVSSVPRFAPSILNCTPTTPTLSDAVAVIVVVPETVAPLAGAVILTVGGVVSFETVTVIAAEVVVFPAASRATAVSVCPALRSAVVSHATAYGAAVSSVPRFAP